VFKGQRKAGLSEEIYLGNFEETSTMKSKLVQLLSIAAAATTTVIASVGAPAQAATFLGVNEITNSPYMKGIGPVIPNATKTFSFDKDTTYQFSVVVPDGLGSRGKDKSNFGFLSNSSFTALFTEGKDGNAYNPGSKANNNDWLGTCNITINAPCTVSYTFKKGVEYKLGLEDSGSKKFSGFGVAQKDSYTFDKLSDEFYPNPLTPAYVNNPNNADKFVTVSQPGTYFLGMEDGTFKQSAKNFYYDYQDWVVAVTPASVPEPGTVGALLGVGALGLIGRRRRQGAHN
jgi:hypothetical protein